MGIEADGVVGEDLGVKDYIHIPFKLNEYKRIFLVTHGYYTQLNSARFSIPPFSLNPLSCHHADVLAFNKHTRLILVLVARASAADHFIYHDHVPRQRHKNVIFSRWREPCCTDDFPPVRTKLCFPDGIRLCGNLVAHILQHSIIFFRTPSVTIMNKSLAHVSLGGTGSSPCSKAWAPTQQVRTVRTSANPM